VTNSAITEPSRWLTSSPRGGRLDLGPQLAAGLLEIGVVPHVAQGAGQAALAVQQRGGMGDGA
jgi:hypothetical protein